VCIGLFPFFIFFVLYFNIAGLGLSLGGKGAEGGREAERETQKRGERQRGGRERERESARE